jgi:hypothetical protein
MWNEFHFGPNISAWEYQLQPRRHKVCVHTRVVVQALRLLLFVAHAFDSLLPLTQQNTHAHQQSTQKKQSKSNKK